MHRPVEQWLTTDGGPRKLVARSEYVDASSNAPNATLLNLCGQLHKHFDPGGHTLIERVDFKGSVLAMRRQLTAAYKDRVVDWQGNPQTQLETETFVQLPSTMP